MTKPSGCPASPRESLLTSLQKTAPSSLEVITSRWGSYPIQDKDKRSFSTCSHCPSTRRNSTRPASSTDCVQKLCTLRYWWRPRHNEKCICPCRIEARDGMKTQWSPSLPMGRSIVGLWLQPGSSLQTKHWYFGLVPVLPRVSECQGYCGRSLQRHFGASQMDFMAW